MYEYNPHEPDPDIIDDFHDDFDIQGGNEINYMLTTMAAILTGLVGGMLISLVISQAMK